MILGLIVALIVVNRPKNPYIKITWILLIMLFPVFAVPFYFYVDADWGHRLVRARLEEIGQDTPDCTESSLKPTSATCAASCGTPGRGTASSPFGGSALRCGKLNHILTGSLTMLLTLF